MLNNIKRKWWKIRVFRYSLAVAKGLSGNMGHYVCVLSLNFLSLIFGSGCECEIKLVSAIKRCSVYLIFIGRKSLLFPIRKTLITVAIIKSRYLAIRKIKVSQIYSVPRYSFIGRGQKWVWVESVRQYTCLWRTANALRFSSKRLRGYWIKLMNLKYYWLTDDGNCQSTFVPDI